MDEKNGLPEVATLESGDRLFKVADGDGWMGNACLNFGDSEIGYVGGFRQAADLAVEHALSTGHDQDYLVYPIVFGYRQYLELRLKGLVRDASRLLDEADPSPKLMGGHRLSPLWAVVRPLLDRIFSGGSDQLDRIGDRVNEFEAMDPDSFAFRYATTKRGTPSLPVDLRHIDLANMRSVMEKIASALDGADTGIGVYLDDKAERREYYAEERRHYAEEARAEAHGY